MVEEINYVENKIISEYEKLSKEFMILKYRGLTDTKEYEEVRNKLIELKDYCIISSSKLVESNGELDIYEQNDKENTKKIYNITKKNTSMIMGRIFINYSKYVPIYGNIGYEIKEEYQGHGLTVKSLELLTPTLINNGLEYGIICIRPNNISSIKTAERFGANLIVKSQTLDGINKYSINLKLKQKQMKK